MKKIIIIYASVHHQNTKKLIMGVSEKLQIDMISSSEMNGKDFSEYDIVGFASGIYMGKFHKSILNCISNSDKFPKNSFVMCTSGIKNDKYLKNMQKNLEINGFKVLGRFQCKGHDTYGILKFIGGISKGRPNNEDIEKATDFIRNLLDVDLK